MNSDAFLGPIYRFDEDGWSLRAGVRADTGRLEWLLVEFDGEEVRVSHSFTLEHHATSADLSEALGDLPEEVATALVEQVAAQTDPALLSPPEGGEGLA